MTKTATPQTEELTGAAQHDGTTTPLFLVEWLLKQQQQLSLQQRLIEEHRRQIEVLGLCIESGRSLAS